MACPRAPWRRGLAAEGQPAYRAKQIRHGVWRQGAVAAEELRTLPAGVRASLERAFRVDTIAADEVTVSDKGLTEKALHLLSDGALVESVLMHYPARGRGEDGRPEHRERHTLCISSQAGCAVGCPFCATGELGFGRDLETAEILDQIRHAARRLAPRGAHLTNVVFMGMGEPLLNLDRVLEAVAALSDPQRFGLGARHVVVSTSGVVPGIRRLTELNPQFTLAISLHAARDPLRDVLVPLNRRWPVAEVVAAARDHTRKTGRRVSYEYVMIFRRERHRPRRGLTGRPVARRPCPRQPDPDEPRRPHALAGQHPTAGRAVRRAPAAGRRRRHGPAQSRPGRRRGVRPAGSGAGRSRLRPWSLAGARSSSGRARRPFGATAALSALPADLEAAVAGRAGNR